MATSRNSSQARTLTSTMRLFLASTLLLLLAPASAAACERGATGDRYETRLRIESSRDDTMVRTAVVACDHRTGRRTVLRRATMHAVHGVRARGVRVTDAAGAGRFAAWIETRGKAGRWTLRLVMVDFRRHRVVRRWVERAREQHPPTEEVAVTDPGDLAWTANRRLHVAPAGRRPRTLAGPAGYLAFEDGRTLRWVGDGVGHYLDLRPPQTEDGCPRRERFRSRHSNAIALVTRAEYLLLDRGDDEGVGLTVIRACDRATGRDPVIAAAQDYSEGGEYVVPVALSDRWVVLQEGYISFRAFTVRTVDVRGLLSGLEAHIAADEGIGSPEPRRGITVTDRGSPAWVTGVDADRLVAISSTGELIRLDEAPEGAVTELRAQGTAVAWRNAGEPRSAEIP